MKKSKFAAVVLAAAMSVSVAAVPTFAAGASLTDLSTSGQTLIDGGVSALQTGADSALNTGYGLASDAAADTYQGAQTVLDIGSDVTDNYADGFSNIVNGGVDLASDFILGAASDANSVPGKITDMGINLAAQGIRDLGYLGGEAANKFTSANRDGIKEVAQSVHENNRELLKQGVSAGVSMAGKAIKLPFDVASDAISTGLSGVIGGTLGGLTGI